MNKKMVLYILAAVVAALVVWAFIAFIPIMFYTRGYTVAEQQALTVVAHRGGASLAPENTLACIEQGIAAGADMVEIDIHLTLDGHVVVCHDQSIDRTTDGSGLIRDLTLEQIRSHRIIGADGKPTEERIPTLAEVIELVAGRCGLLVEIKRTADIYQGIERKTLDIIDRCGAREWTVIQSFNDSVLDELHRLDPSMPLEKLIIGFIPGTSLAVDGGIRRFDFDRYNFVQSVNLWMPMATKSFIDDAHAHGLKVRIWTVGAPDRTLHLPVDAVITNYPQFWNHERR